jgi:hypothetical protein
MVVPSPERQYQVANGVGVDEPRPSTPSVPVEEEAARFTVSGLLTHSSDDVRSWSPVSSNVQTNWTERYSTSGGRVR